ncbi:MAG: Jag N-terminal domain-containing protein [Deltaproteobacteria bacterium]|nr:Jag N-terminal domain-containing protein [Deltaproteobacteria bacterium]
MEGIEIEGKNIDEAIEKACREFRVPRDKLNIEIIADGNSGFLGLGAKKARIRAGLLSIDMTIDTMISRTETAVPARMKKFAAPTMEGHGAGSAAAGSGLKFTSPTPKTRPAVQPAATRQLVKIKAPEYTEHRTAAKPHSAFSAVDDGLPPAEKAKRLLEGLLVRMELTSPVTVEETEQAIILNIQGDGSGLLIGKRGQNLDAIQYIVNKAVHHTANGHKLIIIDTEEYRKRREESLVALAVRLGDKVKKTKRPVTVGHMNAHDRRVIHMAMQNDEILTTKSRGEGEYRKILILPARRGTDQTDA